MGSVPTSDSDRSRGHASTWLILFAVFVSVGLAVAAMATHPLPPARTTSDGRVRPLVPAGGTLAIGDDVGTVHLVDAVTGTSRGELLPGRAGRVRAVAFSPDGATLASVAEVDTTVRLWDVVTGALRQTLVGHASAVVTVAWAPTAPAWPPATRTVSSASGIPSPAARSAPPCRPIGSS